MRGFVGGILWVGRATVFLVGLAVILAVVFGLASTALGANGNPFLLGKENAASQVRPEAAPGYLCIYEWEEYNERNGSGYPFISNTNRTGTGITIRSETTGIFYSEGVWAVTAP